MSVIRHPFLGLEIGDPASIPLSAEHLPSADEVQAQARSLILSASGWRKVFADPVRGTAYAPWALEQNAENSLSPCLSNADRVISAGMAMVFASFMKERTPGRTPVVVLGIDTRPTGPAIADIFARVLISAGCGVRYLFIVPAPEIMAYVASTTSLPPEHAFHTDGFAYISASHNPPGHNGVKFGIGGGVLSASEIAPLISALKQFLADPQAPQTALKALKSADPAMLAACYENAAHWKRYSHSAYMLAAHRIFTDEESIYGQELILGSIARACAAHPLGVVAELNGSARTQSIDQDWLGALGVEARVINAEPGAFAHRIVPENESLEPCRETLSAIHAENPSFILGYVPDCDGDRGNLVYWSERARAALILEAQQVFALACLSELAFLRWKKETRPLAVVVNDATSMRIEAIAERLGARVFRAETGEANVVALADSLRAKGFAVRILGEGSNGGNITYPGRVRDPLSTLGSLIRLLRLRDPDGKTSLFRLWLEVCGEASRYNPDFSLDDIIETLPPWVTTSAFEPYAALKISTSDKVLLKTRYRDLFAAAWPRVQPELERWLGISSWRAYASLGSEELEIGDDFGASGNGGLRIVFLDRNGRARAFLWMRGSGTEPVFRIMVDIEGGTPADEARLRKWHSGMVMCADRNAEPGLEPCFPSLD